MKPFFPAVSKSYELSTSFKKLGTKIAGENEGSRVLNLGMIGRKSAFEIVEKTRN